MQQKIQKEHLLTHETKRHVVIKFACVCIIFILYAFFIMHQYGAQQGLLVALLTWSFFVLCTPIADAGFLIDFPLRLITHMRMVIAEIFVWFIAISLNIYAFYLQPHIYDTTTLLTLFKHILDQPIPFWLIIFLSMIGTFASIIFGDELLDKTHHIQRTVYHTHKNNYRLIIMIFVFIASLIVYDFLLKKIGVHLPL